MSLEYHSAERDPLIFGCPDFLHRDEGLFYRGLLMDYLIQKREDRRPFVYLAVDEDLAVSRLVHDPAEQRKVFIARV